MSTSIISLLSISFASSIILLLIPKSKLHKGVKIISSLLIISSILNVLSPLISIYSSVDFNNSTTEINLENDEYSDELINKTGQQICIYTKEMLHTKFDIPLDALQVSATLEANNENTVYLKMVSVRLLYEINVDEYLISKAVSDTLMCECTVFIQKNIGELNEKHL